MPLLSDVTRFLESIAPPALQEDYDNAGLIYGNPHQEVTGILTTLDCLPEAVEEAIALGANVVVAHHPLLFRGVKKINPSHWAGKTLELAIRHGVALYAIHTNLDNILPGVNTVLGQRLGLEGLKPLRPKKGILMHLTVMVPDENRGTLLDALYAAGAGQVGNYSGCSFTTQGLGTFTPGLGTNPHIGTQGRPETVQEARVEVIFPSFRQKAVLAAMNQAHPYEEVAYFLQRTENEWQEAGSGAIGHLPQAMTEEAFLAQVCRSLNIKTIKHTRLLGRPVQRVALCGGAGSFLLEDAKAAGAQVFLTGDFKHHEFLEADGRIVVADVGHYESEYLVAEYLASELGRKFATFAVNFSKRTENPVSTFIP